MVRVDDSLVLVSVENSKAPERSVQERGVMPLDLNLEHRLSVKWRLRVISNNNA